MHGAAPSGPGPHRGALIALDCAAAAAYTSLSTATALVGGPPAPAAAVTALTAAVGLPVAARRLLPRTVFWTVLAVSLPAVLLGVVGDPLLAAGFALYTVAAEERGPAGRAPVVVGAVAAAALLAAAIGGWDGSAALPDRLGLLVSGAAVLVGAWAVGRSVHDRRVQARRAAEEPAARVAAEERLKVARDVHDIVSHTLSLIGVRAGVARHVAEARPEEARAALGDIEEVARGALTEMRGVLGAVRAPGEERSPVPGPGDLGELARRAELAGVRVELDAEGVEELPEAVGAAVYRIAAEAVTNVVRHAGTDRCTVRVAPVPSGEGGRAVQVEITDEGGGHLVPLGRAGHGIIGMSERARAHGGTLTAAPRARGGFAVVGRIPLPPREERR
ncbi:sensor histidine kinase [Nocardiopsis composta]|uniref:histidine kinase n=1 Tax=Nocardiopsis composta TaxID=157465 RepID=A0A7W8QI34_9ACTN|nr:histidine kinase [Nocardiopsis composta]MBB5430624.1 signal transduction histidine kinase [Nocardiopsis composta]